MGEYDISPWRLASPQLHTPSDPKMATGVRTDFSSPESFAVASEGKSARQLFRQSLEFMVLKDHEFGHNPTSPPYAFHPYPFHMGISL